MVRRALILILVSVVFLQAQDASREAKPYTPGKVLKRFEWFYSQRAFPYDTLRQGYLLEAYKTVKQNGLERTSLLDWIPVGPAPATDASYGKVSGRIPAVAPHPTNPNIIYIGAANGGVWKTNDGGVVWTPLTDFLPTTTSGSLAIDPTNPNILYYGTGEKYSAIDAYGGVGILKSTDGGVSWSNPVLTTEKRTSKIAISPTNTSIVLAAMWGGVYRSVDAGSSWSLVIPHGKGWDVRFDPSNPSIVYAAIGENSIAAGVWKSTNGGATWTQLAGGLPAPSNIRRIAMDISRSSPSTIWTLMASISPSGGYLGLYKSTNGGSSWTSITDSSLWDLFGTVGGGGQGFYDITVGVPHPTNQNIVLVGGRTLRRSTDGGTSWTRVGGSALSVDEHDIAFGPGGTYLGGDQGIWHSADFGATWVNINGNLAISQFYALGLSQLVPSNVYGGTQDCGMMRTTGSAQWPVMFPGDGATSLADYANPNIIFWTLTGGLRRRSLDGGANSITIHNGITTGEPSNWVTPIAIDPNNPQVWYTGTHRMYKSNNRGDLWIPTTAAAINNGLVLSSITIDYANPSIIYVTSNNKAFRTNDGGSSWSDVTSGLPSRVINDIILDPQMSSTTYAVLSGTGSGHIYKSTNYGVGWTNISGNLPDLPVNSLVVHPMNRSTLYAGTDLGLFFSEDGGGIWSKDASFPNTVVADLAVSSDGYLFAATHGRSMMKASIGQVPFVTVTRPNGGETLILDSLETIRWNSGNFSGPVKIELSRDNGSTLQVLFSSAENDGEQTWRVSGVETATGRIRISSLNVASVSDMSDANFSISQASLTVTAPNGNEVWPIGSTQTIRWISSNVPGNVKIELTRNGGFSYEVIYPSIPNVGLKEWSVTSPATTHALVRVSSVQSPSVSDESNNTHLINLLETVRVPVSPLWNIVSLPMIVADRRKDSVFPTAISVASTFGAAGYVVRDTLRYGEGYWLKFAAAETVSVTGSYRQFDTIHVRQGWNFIGSISTQVSTSSIVQIPHNIVASPYFGYSRLGYSSATVLLPMHGYWVKVIQSGRLVLIGSTSAKPEEFPVLER